MPIEKVIKKIDNLQDKVKFTAFGRTRIKGNKKVGKEGTITSLTDIELLKKQSAKIEEEINRIKEGKGGRSKHVFKMKKNN